MQFQLYCQEPGAWHPTTVTDQPSAANGLYEIDDPTDWVRAMSPYLQKLCSVLKYAAPLAGPVLGVAAAQVKEVISNDLDLMTSLIEKLPEIKQADPLHGHEKYDDPDRTPKVGGAELRALRSMLDEKDKARIWGGLEKKRTPEGHYLWLCPDHARKYE